MWKCRVWKLIMLNVDKISVGDKDHEKLTVDKFENSVMSCLYFRHQSFCLQSLLLYYMRYDGYSEEWTNIENMLRASSQRCDVNMEYFHDVP